MRDRCCNLPLFRRAICVQCRAQSAVLSSCSPCAMPRAIRSTAAVQSVRNAAHNLLPNVAPQVVQSDAMESTLNHAFPESLLAAMPQLSEKPHMGVPSKNPAWHPGFNVCNSTAVLGLQFRCSETVSGPVVAPNNPQQPQPQQPKPEPKPGWCTALNHAGNTTVALGGATFLWGILADAGVVTAPAGVALQASGGIGMAVGGIGIGIADAGQVARSLIP